MRKRSSLIFLCLWLGLTLSAKAELVFETTFNNREKHEFVFEIEQWGMFSIQADSPDGTSLQLVDKKTGPGKISGIPGEGNGRLDQFLNEGRYKIIARSHPQSEEQTTVKIMRYDELHVDNPQYIIDYKLYEVELRDLQQISYWIEVKKDTTLQIEAAGRNLSNLELWKEGLWRISSQQQILIAKPIPETPLKVRQFSVQVKPGYYLLTAYGGKEADWAKNSRQHPLYLKKGIPQIAAAGSGIYEIDPCGYNQYLTTKKVKRIIVETAKKEQLNLEISPFSPDQPYRNPLAMAIIDEKSSSPRCIINPSTNEPFFRIKISTNPSRVFQLQTFGPKLETINIDESGN